MAKKSRDKGANGEREVVMLLNNAGIKAERNLSQTRDGGSDIDLPAHAIEVKRAEKESHTTWMRQCIEQAKDKTPVLAWRKSREPWRFAVVMDKDQFTKYLQGEQR
ncbi:MAG: hypothetical protein QGI29_05145 [Pirellulales bacterium]|jgi:Holliday junction resolvase|nr:hypothetical protein [Pirellulales bacterium]